MKPGRGTADRLVGQEGVDGDRGGFLMKCGVKGQLSLFILSMTKRCIQVKNVFIL